MLLGGIQIAAGAVAANCAPNSTPSPTASPSPSPSPTAGGAIALRARVNSRYVSAANAGASALIANATTVGAWERFDMIDRGSGNIALRARVNNMYVCADN